MAETSLSKKEEQALQGWGAYEDETGFENQSSEDMAIPFISQLQSLSPEVDEGSDKYIPGAKPGQLLNTVTLEVSDSQVFIPCYTDHKFVEWIPRENGGGFVAVHEINSEVVAKAKANGTFGNYKTDAGNDLVETYSIYCLTLDDVESQINSGFAVIAFTGTKIKVYKRLTTRLRTLLVGGKCPPIFAHRLLLGSISERSPQGPYKNYEISPAKGSTLLDSLLPPDHELVKIGHELMKQVRGGERKASYETANVGAETQDPQDTDWIGEEEDI